MCIYEEYLVFALLRLAAKTFWVPDLTPYDPGTWSYDKNGAKLYQIREVKSGQIIRSGTSFYKPLCVAKRERYGHIGD